PPILETILIDGNVAVELVLKFMTIALPPPFVPPLTWRFGVIAPLNSNRDGLVTLPLWNSECVAGLISYQRTSAPAPPLTVCCVQSANLLPCPGSIAAWAWVLRVSELSILNDVPFCGTDGGIV